MHEISEGLQRPCSADIFCDHYTKRGCYLDVRDGKGICAFYDHEIIDTWTFTEGVTVGLSTLGESMKAAIQPALDWFNSLPPTVQSAPVRKPVQLRKGKRHRPSRHRY